MKNMKVKGKKKQKMKNKNRSMVLILFIERKIFLLDLLKWVINSYFLLMVSSSVLYQLNFNSQFSILNSQLYYLLFVHDRQNKATCMKTYSSFVGIYNPIVKNDESLLYKSYKKLSYITKWRISFEFSENFCYIYSINKNIEGD